MKMEKAKTPKVYPSIKAMKQMSGVGGQNKYLGNLENNQRLAASQGALRQEKWFSLSMDASPVPNFPVQW